MKADLLLRTIASNRAILFLPLGCTAEYNFIESLCIKMPLDYTGN